MPKMKWSLKHDTVFGRELLILGGVEVPFRYQRARELLKKKYAKFWSGHVCGRCRWLTDFHLAYTLDVLFHPQIPNSYLEQLLPVRSLGRTGEAWEGRAKKEQEFTFT